MTREQRAKKRVRELEVQLEAAKAALADAQRDRVLKSAGVSMGDTVWVNLWGYEGGRLSQRPWCGRIFAASPRSFYSKKPEIYVQFNAGGIRRCAVNEIFKTREDALAACKVTP